MNTSPVPLPDEVHALRERFHYGDPLTRDELVTTARAFLAEAERMHLAFTAHNKRHAEGIEQWASYADLERVDKERYLAAFAHVHVAWGDSDTCRQCGLDLRDPIHAQPGKGLVP